MVVKKYNWGIDLGGTKVEGVILERPSNKVIARERIATEQQHGYRHILGRIKAVVDLLSENTGLKPTCLGIGTPGTIDNKKQTLKNANTVCLNGRPLRKDLSDLLGIEVLSANDANCFALAETTLGIVPDVVPDAKVVFGVIMGTGVGGGVVINGKVINGLHGIAGEWGHSLLDENGVPCYCGKRGCVETIIAGPALQRYYAELSGNEKKLQDIVKLHHNGEDAAATKTINRLLFNFGKALGPIINLLDPDAIILGGGVGNIDLLYSHGPEEVSKHIFNHELNTPILKPKLGDSAGVFGAAMLVEE
ncbi:MAG: ROK family protein [Bacteroidota bacterium]